MHLVNRFALLAAAASLAMSVAGTRSAAGADPTTPAAAKRVGPLSAAAKAAIAKAIPATPVIHVTTHRQLPRLATAVSLTVEPGAVRPLNANVARAIGTAKTCEALDPSIPPQIAKLEGKIGSGGYLVITGTCFGTQGVVELVGDFPGGRLALQNRTWTPAQIITQIPSVTGVYDQTVHIRVVRGNVVSNEVAAAFTPEMENRLAPAALLVVAHCDFADDDCAGGQGRHYSHNNDFTYSRADGTTGNNNGVDRWTVQPPRDWSIDYVDTDVFAGRASTADFDSVPGKASTLSVQWEDVLTQISSPLIGASEKYYAGVYGLTVHLVGPKGTWR